MKKSKRTRHTPRLDARDRALLAETIGYLRGVASGYNDDDLVYRSVEPLASRLRVLERKLWPLDAR